jgi:hypothetical protein
LPRQNTYKLNNIGLDRPKGLPDFVLRDRHLRVVATLSLNDKCRTVVDNINYDFFDEKSDDLLARLDGCTRTVPRLGQALAEGHQPRTILRREPGASFT